MNMGSFLSVVRQVAVMCGVQAVVAVVDESVREKIRKRFRGDKSEDDKG